MRRQECSKTIARISSKVYSKMADLTSCWPVGALFFAASDKEPAVLLGFGKWEPMGEVTFKAKDKPAKTLTAWAWRRVA